jgi:hypothetical protein
MIPLFDPDGDLPQGMHQTTWTAFRERFCIFARSDRRLRLCRQIEQMLEEAQASRIVERLIFGGSFVTNKSEPNDFDCIIVLKAETHYEDLSPFQGKSGFQKLHGPGASTHRQNWRSMM